MATFYSPDDHYGTDDGDYFMGSDEGNWFYGKGGNDTIAGNAGVDYLLGDDGNDIIVGGDNNDYLWGDSAHSSSHTGNDSLIGGAGHDHVFGQNGNDYLWGGPGNDFLSGGSGFNHRLEGGEGSDTFELVSNGYQHISDFEVGVDKIALGSGLAFADLGFQQGYNATIIYISETYIGIAGVQDVSPEDLNSPSNFV